MKTRHERNEERILYFHRASLSEDVQLATIKIRKGESSTWHYHSVTRDTFYVIKGCLTLHLLIDPASAGTPYHGILPADRVEVMPERAPSVGQLHRVRLVPGDVFVIEPRVKHCAANRDEEVCEFLCIEGVGKYDFVELPNPLNDP